MKPKLIDKECLSHGVTEFILENRGYYRCKKCRSERVVEWRRRLKQKLVEERGGACELCGYDRYAGALQFHHIDPTTKDFAVAGNGITRSGLAARKEIEKCILLCANCHAEIHSGVGDVGTATSLLNSRNSIAGSIPAAGAKSE